MLHGHGHVAVAAKGKSAGEHLVQDDPETVEVGALVGRTPLGLLRREVGGRAHHGAGTGELGVAHAGDAEVGDLHVAVLVDEHVGGRDVAVHDVTLVGGAQRAQHGEGRGRRLVRRQAAVAPQPLLQALAVDVLHDDVRGVARAPPIVHGHDGRVVEARGRLGLDAKALHELVVGGEARLEDLDGDQPAEALVARQVHVRHAAAAQPGADAVATVERRRERERVVGVCVLFHRGGLHDAATGLFRAATRTRGGTTDRCAP